ncbi:hypothetical protein [Chryseobacterium sp. JK1]|uniref:hypothetical protein n=1 Tax=Chryseobacterium sp. JK1 TaxID=874294 RepID=UPI003D69AC79
MKNKIIVNNCSDLVMPKINLNSCDNETVSINEASQVEGHFFDAILYSMESRTREGIIKRKSAISIDYGIYNPSVQIEVKINPK